MQSPHGVFCFLAELAGKPVSTDLPLAFQHTHGFHELLYFRSGSDAMQYCAGQRFVLRPGDLFFLPAGVWHIARTGSRAQAYVMNFYSQAFSVAHPGDWAGLEVLRALQQRDVRRQWHVLLSETVRDKVGSVFADAARECWEQPPGWEAGVEIALHSLLLLLRRETDLGKEISASGLPKPDAGHAAGVEQVFRHIHNHLGEKIEVAELAAIAGLSRSLFHVAFRAHAGMTAMQYVNRLRVKRAVDLLRETTLPLTDIAGQCGFPCLSHFHAVFKSYTGCTPRVMRRVGDEG